LWYEMYCSVVSFAVLGFVEALVVVGTGRSEFWELQVSNYLTELQREFMDVHLQAGDLSSIPGALSTRARFLAV
jgi:hypothetical protein